MDKFLQMALIGVILGSMYGFIAIGMVLVYRTTNVLNVAHGGIGILSAYIAWDLIVLRGLNYYLGVTIGIVFAAMLGFFFEWIVIRRLAGQPALQTGTTLALYILLQGVTGMPNSWTKLQFQILPSPLINKGFRVPHTNNQLVTYDQLILVVSLAVISIALYWMLRRTRVGLAMRAVSDDSSAAPLMGIRHEVVSRVVWTVSFALSGLTTMLLAPIFLLDGITLSLLTVKALTVAFVGGLVSLPLTIAGALSLGVLESYSDIYIPNHGWLKPAWPFILMLCVLAFRFAQGRKTILEDAPAVAA
ncbi:MAG TPA: branched-chain amino acid ABC transporter permease [Acidimicrobiia bacterium]|nr:branched-chain amino acid ABC transporter permease [Acidimicrobiia bacterium]